MYSKLLGNNTFREKPHSSQSLSFTLLMRGGYIRSYGPGLYALLPLGMRVMRNLQGIVGDELKALGGQEVEIPLVMPLRLWKKTGRQEVVNKELIRFRDRTGRALVLSSSHLEAAAELVRQTTNSYRDFPRFIYQFQLKFRDEERVGNGLVRAKEFSMCDAYSFHRSYTALNNFFPRVFHAYEKIFQKCGVEVIPAESSIGAISGERAYEFLMPVDWGDETVLVCRQCGYQANREVAVADKEYFSESPRSMSSIRVPEQPHLKELARHLEQPLSRFVKSKVYKTTKGFVMASVRGDYEVSIPKLSRFLKIPIAREADERELRELGFEPPLISPFTCPPSMDLAVDDAVANSNNLIISSTEKGRVNMNCNFSIDFETSLVGDIGNMRGHRQCIQCGADLEDFRATELGNIFKIGDFFSRSLEFQFQEYDGALLYPHMGSYGIGMGRLMAAVVQANHDDKGIRWPFALAPFKMFLMGIGKSHRVKEMVDSIYDDLGPELVLCDDRLESVGVKFKDADLLGIPYRVVVSTKGLERGVVEFYERRSGRTWDVPFERAAASFRQFMNEARTINS